jgi:phosphomannomutase/phosphoglucomutase
MHEIDIKLRPDVIKRTTLAVAALLLLVMVSAISWLGFVREPAQQKLLLNALGQETVTYKAESLGVVIGALDHYLQSVVAAKPPLNESATFIGSETGIANAHRLVIVPLDELGTANLSPGTQGIKSHIEVDIIRRAFNGEAPMIEAVASSEGVALLFARPYRTQTGERGVALAELRNDFFENILKIGRDLGRYAIVQNAGSARQIIIFGTPIILERGVFARAIPNSTWQLRFQPNTVWLSQFAQDYILWAGLLSGLVLTTLGALGYFIYRVPRAVSDEATRILTASEGKGTTEVSIHALAPLARLLYQLNMLSRRQIAGTAKEYAPAAPPPVPTEEAAKAAEEPQKEEGEAPVEDTETTEQTAAEASVPDDAWVDGVPEHIFREAEIRGLSETELTDDFVVKIGKAIALLANQRGVKTLVIGRDTRPSSERIRIALTKGLLASGMDIVDIGIVPTPLLFFTCHDSEFDSGVMITGGNSGPEINGLRIVMQKKMLLNEEITRILNALRGGSFLKGIGHTLRKDVQEDYINKVILETGVGLPVKVVVDCNHGTTSKLAADLYLNLGCEVITINSDTSHPAKTDSAQSLRIVGQAVLAEGAELGVLFDTDGDRVKFVDNKGRPVGADQMAMLFARDILERNPGSDVVFDNACSRNLAPVITRAGGRPVIGPNGHAAMAQRVQDTKALLGVDFVGHFIITERWYPFDDGLYATARALEFLSMVPDSLSDLVDRLPKAHGTELLSIPTSNERKYQIVRALGDSERFGEARITRGDGIRIDYAASWGIIRPSKSDSAIEARFEAKSPKELTEIQSLTFSVLKTIAPELTLPVISD